MRTQLPRVEGKHQIVVRLPVTLHERLRQQAIDNERSVNAQVIHLIERHLKEAA